MNEGQGKIYYGMHFYPGIAEYAEPDKKPYRVFLNENTIRQMDPSFAGRPIFVEHVDEVEPDVNKLRAEADGWVVESFFNEADGKHWTKFISVSERAENAIKNGFRLSNAYIPKAFGPGGMWNGMTYEREVTAGEFEHLAIVRNPRYEESVIMTPEQFKAYNEKNKLELIRLANSKDKKGDPDMKALSIFKKTKVEKLENGADLGELSVALKSGREVSITTLVNEVEEMEDKKKENMADPKMQVKMHDGSMCNVGELLEKHKALNDEHEMLKKKMDEVMPEEELDLKKDPVDVESSPEMKAKNEEEMKKKNEEDEAKKKLEMEKKKNSKSDFDARMARFEKLKNAHLNADALESAGPEVISDPIARGKELF